MKRNSENSLNKQKKGGIYSVDTTASIANREGVGLHTQIAVRD